MWMYSGIEDSTRIHPEDVDEKMVVQWVQSIAGNKDNPGGPEEFYPSGIFIPRVHPHGVITSLEGLDSSTEEYLEQIHTSHTLMDPLNYSLHQHGHLLLLC